MPTALEMEGCTHRGAGTNRSWGLVRTLTCSLYGLKLLAKGFQVVDSIAGVSQEALRESGFDGWWDPVDKRLWYFMFRYPYPIAKIQVYTPFGGYFGLFGHTNEAPAAARLAPNLLTHITLCVVHNHISA